MMQATAKEKGTIKMPIKNYTIHDNPELMKGGEGDGII